MAALVTQNPRVPQQRSQIQNLAESKMEVTERDLDSVCISPKITGVHSREAGSWLASSTVLQVTRVMVAASSHQQSWPPAALSRPHAAQKRPEVPPPHSPISGINTAARPLNSWFLISPAHLLTTQNHVEYFSLKIASTPQYPANVCYSCPESFYPNHHHNCRQTITSCARRPPMRRLRHSWLL